MNAPSRKPRVAKYQHHVFYVKDLDRSRPFYEALFDLQLSALNHPDSSAAMRLVGQRMQFYSFGHYHHDLCLVQSHRHGMDLGSVSHFTVVARDRAAHAAIRTRAQERNVTMRPGRLLASSTPAADAFAVRDPDGHWIEVLAPAAERADG